MDNQVDIFKNIIETGANLKTIFSTNKNYYLGMGISGTLLLKKSGLITSLRMVFKRNYIPKFIPFYNRRFSIRKDLIKDLKFLITKINYIEGESILVKGEKGIGKSLLIKTLLHHYGGVSKITIRSDKKDIYNTVLSDLFGVIPGNAIQMLYKHSLKSIIFWHKFFLLGRAPIVVIEIFNTSKDRINYFDHVRDVS